MNEQVTRLVPGGPAQMQGGINVGDMLTMARAPPLPSPPPPPPPSSPPALPSAPSARTPPAFQMCLSLVGLTDVVTPGSSSLQS